MNGTDCFTVTVLTTSAMIYLHSQRPGKSPCLWLDVAVSLIHPTLLYEPWYGAVGQNKSAAAPGAVRVRPSGRSVSQDWVPVLSLGAPGSHHRITSDDGLYLCHTETPQIDLQATFSLPTGKLFSVCCENIPSTSMAQGSSFGEVKH